MRPVLCQYKIDKCLIIEAPTCSSRVKEAARLRAFALLSSASVILLAVGLSGGDNSEFGVSFVLLLDRSSESSAYLSKIGSWIWLSGDSAGDSGILLDLCCLFNLIKRLLRQLSRYKSLLANAIVVWSKVA